MHLYWGGRNPASDFLYEPELKRYLADRRLTALCAAFSQVQERSYVQDRLLGDALALRALDGYTARLSLGEARRLGLIVATHLDGQPMALGGLGPLWAVLDADRIPELAAKPLAERFAVCPWGLYHIGVDEPT